LDGDVEAYQVNLAKNIEEFLVGHWTSFRVATWGTPNHIYFKGARERLRWKLDDNKTSDLEYAKAIIDEEFFCFALAADLKHFYTLNDLSYNPAIDEIVEDAYATFLKFTDTSSDGFKFQQGVWSHYRDYRYAGHLELLEGLTARPIENILTDSSHLHRMPLWLKSLRRANGENREFWSDLLRRVAYQFENKILVVATDDFPAPRINNYSDGWNGIYRYNYTTVGNALGYGPYQVSGTLLHSWYAFVDGDSFRRELRKLSNNFSLSSDVLDTYIGPNTTRQRHPLVTWPNYFVNGFAELYVNLAIALSGIREENQVP
jgi:hypothetical protein